MKVFIKILGLLGLINCIVLYGADYKKGDSVAVQISDYQPGRSRTHVGSATGVGTGLYDPSSEIRPDSQERRSSLDGLMQQHNFADEYAGSARQTKPQPPFEKLISRFQDQSTRAFARRFLSDMTPELRDQLNAVAPTSPVHRSRRWSGDVQTGAEDKLTSTVDKQAALVEALMKGMQTDFAQKERIHQEETALLQKQHKERSEQSDRLGQTASNNSRCAILTSGILGGASLALSIAAFTHKS